MTSAVLQIGNEIRDNLFKARLATKLSSSTGFTLLCGVFICVGLGLITYGTYLSLLSQYSPQASISMTGILSLVFAMLIAGLLYATEKYRYLKAQKEKLKFLENFKEALSLLDEEIGDPIRNHPKVSVLIAALSGFLLEDRIF